MEWITKAWFKDLCCLIAFIFFFETVLPMSHGLAQPRIAWDLGPTSAYAQEPEDDLLSSTPDANTSDPYVLNKAAELGHDPVTIFEFVRTEIGYESYEGSLRGARGTLWSKAGNALDQASLLIALLRASGIPARYVRGTLNTAQAQELILSMFPPVLRIVGCPPADAERADPANDPQLLEETQKHYWVEFDDGSGFRPADPTFRGAEIGQTFADAESTFVEVPDDMRHKVTVRVKAEFTSSFPTAPPEIKIPLNETFNAVELVGKPLSIGHFVNSFSPPSLAFGAVTHTYSPYILIGQNDGDISDDPIIRGEDYQEYFTNFPFGSRFLTGLFLEMDVISPDAGVETFERTLIDRIGFVKRQNGGPVELVGVSAEQPSINPLDIMTMNVESSLPHPGVIPRLTEEAAKLREEGSRLAQQLEGSDPTALQPAEQELAGKLLEIGINVGQIFTHLGAVIFSDLSNKTSQRLAKMSLVKAYFNSPRLILISRKVASKNENVSIEIMVDLLKNDMNGVPFPGQISDVLHSFFFARGILESANEHGLISEISINGANEDFVTNNLSAVTVFNEAQRQGIDSLILGHGNANIVEMLDFPVEAKIRILQAIEQGELVFAPDRSVQIGELRTISWFQYDPDTGVIMDVGENGGHQALVVYSKTLSQVATAVFIAAAFTKVIFSTFDQCAEITLNYETYSEDVKTYYRKVASWIIWSLEAIEKGAGLLFAVASVDPWAGLVGGMIFIAAFDFMKHVLWNFKKADPPVGSFLLGISGTLPSIPPSDQPGINVQIVSDELLTIPVNDVEIPSAFRVQIQNTGPTADTFTLTLSEAPPGYTIASSVTEITIPAGETAEVGICLRPLEGIDPPGSPAPFSVDVASTTNPAVTANDSEQFVVPEVREVALATDPPLMNATPGRSVSTTLRVTSVGNVPVDNMTLEITAPSGLTVSGLTSPVSFGVGESVTQFLTFNVAQDTPLNSTVRATITASLDPSAEEPKTASTQVAVQVVTPAAQSAVDAATAAGEVGRYGLGRTLSDLGMVLTELSQDPASSLFQNRAIALLNNLVEQLNGSALTPFRDDFAAQRDAMGAATTPEETLAVVNDLSSLFSDLMNTLSTVEAFPFDVSLSPNSAVALPQTPTRFDVNIHNTGTQTTTYNLSLSPMPDGITGELNRTSITLAAGESVPCCSPGAFITITQTGGELRAFDFTVTVSLANDPDLSRTVQGAFTVRHELVEVVSVKATPGFADAGDQVNVSARLLNAVNRNRRVQVSYTAKDPAGTIVFASVPQEVELTVLSSLDTVDLGLLDTTGFESGTHTLEVTVTDVDGQPIPGAVGQGGLLIGLPVSVDMAVAPETVPPCEETITSSLDINSLMDMPEPGMTLLGLVDTDGIAQSLAIQDNLVYVGGSENITIVDISDHENPQVVDTFADDLIVNASMTFCRIVDNHLVVMWQRGVGVDALPILVFDLNDPLQPHLISHTSANYHYISSLSFRGHIGFATTKGIRTTLGILLTDQFGDVLSFDFSDFENPQLLDVLLNTKGEPDGGNFNMWQVEPVSDDIALVASTTSMGSAAEEGVGRILVMDVSDPGDLSILNDVQIPDTVHATGLGVQGNLALVAGNTGGRKTMGPDFGLSGNVTLTSLDITDPQNPAVIQTITTSLQASWDTTVNYIGNGFFAVSGARSDTGAVVMVVDANDPQDLGFTTLAVPSLLLESRVKDNTLFTPSSSGLGIYDIGNAIGTRVTTRVQIPKGIGVELVPGSFHIEPTEIIPGDHFDILVWERSLSGARTGETLFWQSTLTNMQPGEAREVTRDTTIDFMTPSGDSGRIALPPLLVTSEQILSLTPDMQTAQAGEEAVYSLTVKNPTATEVAYNLSVQGVPNDWVDIVSSVAVPAHGMTDLMLSLTSKPSTTQSEYGFVVTADAENCATGYVHGTMNIQGSVLGEDVDGVTRGVVMTLIPIQETAGQQTQASYAVRLTNTGNVTDSFALTSNCPEHFVSAFAQDTIEVMPGIDTFRDVLLNVTPVPGTAAGNYACTVSSSSTTDPAVIYQVTASVTVSEYGVAVEIDPSSGSPGSPFQILITNTGHVEDTFDVALDGPAALVSTLETNSVTLAAGESQAVGLTVGNIDFAYAGFLDLIAVATSQGNSAVQDKAFAKVIIDDTQGVSVAFDVDTVVLPEPGPADFLLFVTNSGNIEQALSARITGTEGPLTANLSGLDGQPTQTISSFRLPGLSTGAILLKANLQDYGEGSVTVTVASLSSPEITSWDTARTRTGNRAPIANAGNDQTIHIGKSIPLDGMASYDPDEGTVLSYLWSFADKPDDTALTDADISDPATALASFTPDVLGDYLLTLTVSDGELHDSDEVFIEVRNNPPVADAGPDKNVETGTLVTLDGSGSFDPDEDMITYVWSIQWSLDAKPVNSTLADEDIQGRNTPNPSFTPDVDGLYVFRLIVHDGWAESAPDSVAITAKAPNIPPNANAGEDQSVYTGDMVNLDGSRSNDPDDGPASLTYLWRFKVLPPESSLEDTDIFDGEQPQARFIPDVEGVYVLNLKVFDGKDADEDDVMITASYPNVPPNAGAGEDQRVSLGDEVVLDGTASNDPDEGPEDLSFTWSFVSVPDGSALANAHIIDADTPAPRFTPDVAGTYVLQLKVSDGEDSHVDNVMITVIGAPVRRDVTDLIEVSTANERSRLDRRTRMITSTADVTLTNISDTTIAGPIHAVFLLSAAGVAMPEASGVNTDGDLYYDLSEKTGIQDLSSGESITVGIQFVRSASVRFTYEIRVSGFFQDDR
jgi:uncharacterized membrane protein